MKRTITGNEKGFTLIELLVVVAIIGILVAIAIPQFSAYKKQANDSAAESDARNMALAAEAYYAAWNNYPATLAATASTGVSSTTYTGFSGTKNVTVAFTNNGGTPPTFTITATHSGGTGKTYIYDSRSGGMQ